MITPLFSRYMHLLLFFAATVEQDLDPSICFRIGYMAARQGRTSQ